VRDRHRIAEIAVYVLELPLHHPYALSGGRLEVRQLDTTLVRLTTDRGVYGWGEACPWGSTYLAAFPGGIRAGIAELAPAVLGADPQRPEVLDRAMDAALPGHEYVKAAIDIACYDIAGKVDGVTVADLLGGDTGESVVVQSSLPTDTPEAMVGSLRRAQEAGYRVHSPKVGSGVVEDVARIRAIGADVGPEESVTFDANRAWLPDEAVRVMHLTSDVDAYFEQPCETYEEHLAVRARTDRPLILDESIVTISDIMRAATDRACDAIGLKLNRVGGLTKARRIRDICIAAGIRMNIEETGGTALADTAAVHLARATPARFRRATWLCHEMLTVDPIEGGARNDGGDTGISDVPGLGAEPVGEQLADPVAVYRV